MYDFLTYALQWRQIPAKQKLVRNLACLQEIAHGRIGGANQLSTCATLFGMGFATIGSCFVAIIEMATKELNMQLYDLNEDKGKMQYLLAETWSCSLILPTSFGHGEWYSQYRAEFANNLTPVLSSIQCRFLSKLFFGKPGINKKSFQ